MAVKSLFAVRGLAGVNVAVRPLELVVTVPGTGVGVDWLSRPPFGPSVASARHDAVVVVGGGQAAK